MLQQIKMRLKSIGVIPYKQKRWKSHFTWHLSDFHDFCFVSFVETVSFADHSFKCAIVKYHHQYFYNTGRTLQKCLMQWLENLVKTHKPWIFPLELASPDHISDDAWMACSGQVCSHNQSHKCPHCRGVFHCLQTLLLDSHPEVASLLKKM